MMESEATHSLFAGPLDALTQSREKYRSLSDEEKGKVAKVSCIIIMSCYMHSYVLQEAAENREGGAAIRLSSLKKYVSTQEYTPTPLRKNRHGKKKSASIRTPLATIRTNSSSSSSFHFQTDSTTSSFSPNISISDDSLSINNNADKENTRCSASGNGKRKQDVFRLDDDIPSDNESESPFTKRTNLSGLEACFQEDLEDERTHREEVLELLRKGQEHNEKALALQERAIASTEKLYDGLLAFLQGN